MNKEIDMNDLIGKYPKIFKNASKPCQETCMCWGICCGSGWYNLIDRLCSALQWNTDHNDYPQVVADQVKSKYASLHFYFHCEPNPNKRKPSRAKIFNWLVHIWNDGILRGYERLEYIHIKIGKRYIRFFPNIWTWQYRIPTEFDKQDAHIDGMIGFAEDMSSIICESCGNLGKINEDDGWMDCLCEKCRNIKDGVE